MAWVPFSKWVTSFLITFAWIWKSSLVSLVWSFCFKLILIGVDKVSTQQTSDLVFVLFRRYLQKTYRSTPSCRILDILTPFSGWTKTPAVVPVSRNSACLSTDCLRLHDEEKKEDEGRRCRSWWWWGEIHSHPRPHLHYHNHAPKSHHTHILKRSQSGAPEQAGTSSVVTEHGSWHAT